MASWGTSSEITDDKNKMSTALGSGMTASDFSPKKPLKDASEVFGTYVAT